MFSRPTRFHNKGIPEPLYVQPARKHKRAAVLALIFFLLFVLVMFVGMLFGFHMPPSGSTIKPATEHRSGFYIV